MANNRIPLSALIRNPVVADAFRRAERDNGSAMALPAPKGPVLIGGEVA
ncbi:hypothetical protein [Agrobacterium radiobacter]